VKRIDTVFDLERAINGADAGTRLTVWQEETAPLVAELHQWMRAERERLSRHVPVAKAMNYMLSRWLNFTRFLEDGRICLTNNAAERELRGAALGRKAWLFAGSERGGDRGRLHVHADQHRQAQWHRPARLARRRLALPELPPRNWAPLPAASQAA
jgi:hypothetical protein